MRAAVLSVVLVLLAAGCGTAKYAGLSRGQAQQAALQAITGQRNVDPKPIDEQKSTNTLGGDAWVVQFQGTDGTKWCVWVWQRPGDQIGSGFSSC